MLIPRGIYRDRDRRSTFRIRYGIRGADRLCHGIPQGYHSLAGGTKTTNSNKIKYFILKDFINSNYNTNFPIASNTRNAHALYAMPSS